MNTTAATQIQDTGLYLQGLLQIMAIDKNLHERQKEVIRQFAIENGFEQEYIESSIENVLKNPHIPKKPPKFFSSETAEKFLKNAAYMAICDGSLHPKEKRWLLDAARHNQIEPAQIIDILNKIPAGIA